MAECTIYDKLRYISETKELIKTAIETQDVEVLESDTFRQYAEYITEIRKVASINGQTGDIILKTINGQDLVGEGDITIEGGSGETIDLSNYYTKEEVDALLEPKLEKVELTQAEYDALETKDENTLYVITDATSSDETSVDLSNYYTKDELKYNLTTTYNSYDGYDQIITNDGSALNVAHINGQSILGQKQSITIEGGSSSEETDPIFTTWKDRNYVTLGNGATDSGEANGIVIGYSSTGNNNSISIGQYANAYFNSIAIGKQATTTNSGDVAIGNEGGGVATDSTYRLNISNIIKGDRSDYLYIKNANDEYIKIIDTYYTKTEIDELIGGVTDKISEINEMI